MKIGIDLGTTNTVVSFVNEYGEIKTVKFNNGRPQQEELLPSAVVITNGRTLVGNEAVEYSLNTPTDIIEGLKREMGSNRAWYFGGARVEPEEAAAYILTAVREELQRQFPDESFNAFVTVPAGFNSQARLATKTALQNAGFDFNEHCLADEPVAAARAAISVLDPGENILVVDIGGGTFDVALLRTCGIAGGATVNSLQVIDRNSDLNEGLHLAGDDIDKLLTDDIISCFNRETYVDLSHGFNSNDETANDMKRAIANIRTLILGIKNDLYCDSAHIAMRTIIADIGNKHYEYTYEITEERYRNLLYQNNIPHGYEKCITDLLNRHSDIRPNRVLIVGGMAHELCLNDFLLRRFGADNLIIPDDALFLVSRGAAIFNSNSEVPVEFRAYSSIGILEEDGKSVIPIIKEGDPISGKRIVHKVRKVNSSADALRITVVEYKGDFQPRKYAKLLERDIPIKKRHSLFDIPVSFKFEYDEDKILTISVGQGTGKTEKLELNM